MIETVTEHVYICECGEVLISKASEAKCTRCKKPMESTGWAESKQPVVIKEEP